MDPTNPEILYVTFWQRVRYPWALKSGGPNSGIFKSTNGGTHVDEAREGLAAWRPGPHRHRGLAQRTRRC